MGVAGVFGLINTRIIIGHFGTDAYAQNGLLATFPSLMPFTDLGIGAVILNTVAGSEDLPRDAVVRRTLTTAVRVLLISSLVIATATLFDCTHYDGLDDFALFDVAAGDRVLDRGNDGVTDVGVTTLRATENADAQELLGTSVVGDLESRLLLDHLFSSVRPVPRDWAWSELTW